MAAEPQFLAATGARRGPGAKSKTSARQTFPACWRRFVAPRTIRGHQEILTHCRYLHSQARKNTRKLALSSTSRVVAEAFRRLCKQKATHEAASAFMGERRRFTQNLRRRPE